MMICQVESFWVPSAFCGLPAKTQNHACVGTQQHLHYKAKLPVGSWLNSEKPQQSIQRLPQTTSRLAHNNSTSKSTHLQLPLSAHCRA